jgi:hypothetical protein
MYHLLLTKLKGRDGHQKKPLNNVTTSYSLKHDPALSFCKSVLSCENLEMIFIVKSFSGNFGQRIAIRNTYEMSKASE